MSENVRSMSCRPNVNRSSRWITLMMIVAMCSFAGLVFADSGNNHGPKSSAPKKFVSDDPANPAGDEPTPAGATNVAAGPANDTCAGAVELFLGIIQKVDSVGAADDYQTPATAACYPDVPNASPNSEHTQVPSLAPGRDVVFKFTAPDTDSYSVRLVVDAVTNDFRNQNGVLYLVDGPGCFGAGTVACLKGANRLQSRVFTSAVGVSNNHGEEVNCVPLTAGQTVYAVFDDHKAGNAGSNPKIEVIKCVSESEPNDTIAQANAYSCDVQGVSHVAPSAHCWLGTNDGLSCRRTTPLDVGFVGETDVDCDPRCVGGPNAGLTCARTTPSIPNSNTFCNPVTDVGAFCAGTCVVDSVCILGPTPGVPCTATCNGGARAGQFCSAITGCGTGFLCIQNLSCGNGTTQNPAPGKCTTQNNEGDADFFSLGNVPAGNKIFTAIDANTANDMDWRLRVTDTVDTLGFDDDDGNFNSGDFAPVVAGAIATGGDTYIKVSRSIARVSEPYHLNAIVRPPLAAAQVESEFNANGIQNTIYYYWPGNTIAATPITAGGYINGFFNALEADCYKFCVNKGDLMHWYGDGNPNRTTPPTLGQLAQPIPYDSDNAGISNFIFGANARKSDLPTVPSPGLNGLTPAVTSSYIPYRATYTGEIEVCFYEPSSRVTPAPIPAYAPGPYAGSLGVNCGPIDDCTTVPADVTATKTGPVGPVNSGSIITYSIVVTNNGPGIAADIHLQDFLDPSVVFISLEIEDGFDSDEDGAEGDNTACFLLPTPGQNDAFVDCINASLAPGASTTYLLTVQVNNCIGPDVPVFNAATIDTRSIDPNAGTCDILNIFTGNFETLPCENPTWEFTTSEDGSCNDIVCDEVSCTGNACTTDSCVDGVCVSTDNPPCDDSSICTEDSCAPATGCVFDSSQLGDLCDNGGADQCIEDYCDPVLFCQTRPVNCDDSNACTSDSCNSASGCVNTPIVCDDGNACTDDSCNPATGCVATNNTNPCDDGSACTTNDACGGGTCGGTPVSCDDGTPCTTDSCDPETGCSNVDLGICHAQITSDAGTCTTFTNGTALDLNQGSYTTKGNSINAATPGVMVYWSQIVAPSASFAFAVNEAIAPNSACAFPNWPALGPQSLSQANLYSGSCGNRSSSSSFDSNTGTLTMSVTGATPGETLVIGIKYRVSDLKGTAVCRPHPIETYTFGDSVGNSDTLVFIPKN
jgi:uncharacterized repeat protein (TIGR01451 family)